MRVLIRGAGDLASGIALRLFRCGIRVVMTDLPFPSAIRRTVAFSRALEEGSCQVEDVEAVGLFPGQVKEDALLEAVTQTLQAGKIPVLADPGCRVKQQMAFDALVDAILAKKNLGTRITDAPVVIGVGPGFYAGRDCHAVVETRRGHTLGRVIYEGPAIENTGVPGLIGGYGLERVLRSPIEGTFRPLRSIGELVSAGEAVCLVRGEKEERMLSFSISGKIRGMLPEGFFVTPGFKCADVDPRGALADHTTASDKALAIGGGVLEALLSLTGLLSEQK